METRPTSVDAPNACCPRHFGIGYHWRGATYHKPSPIVKLDEQCDERELRAPLCFELTSLGRNPVIADVFENRTMITRLMFSVIALVSLSFICNADEASSRFTAPQFLVDAKVVKSPHGPTLVAARLYFEQIKQSFHSGSQPILSLKGNRVRQVSILQSEWIRFPFGISKITTIDGKKLTVEEVDESLTTPVAVLMIPADAELHPSIKNALKPGTIVVSRDREKSPVELVQRPKPR